MTETSKAALAEWESKLSFDLLLGLLIKNGSISSSDAAKLCSEMVGYIEEAGSQKPEFSAAAQPSLTFWEQLATRHRGTPHSGGIQ
jgi:hypothetical protein